MLLPLGDVVAATGAELIEAPGAPAPAAVDGASIDSRRVAPGQLFVAVIAERDGHEFLAGAAARGAAAGLVSRPVEVADCPMAQLVVDDTVVALGRLGGLARDRIEGAVIGITGSVGKTSVKDLLAAICGGAGVTTASARSLNNEMGVPLTLINAAPGTERTIVEMGARGTGHIAYLCGIARPTIGIVTTVAEAHTEMFGSIDGVAAAKSELIAALPASGTAILNAEVPLVAAMASVATGDVITFGNGGDVRATAVRLDADLHAHFTLSSPWGSAEISLGVRGEHNVANALAAAAAGLVSGVSMDHVVAGLAAAELSPSRMDLSRLASGGIVLNDAYNANPASMLAGLRALAALDVGRRVAVLGLMAELGDDAAARHSEMAEVAAGLGIEVVAVGTDLYGIVPLTDADEVLARIAPPVDGEAVLLKGSRIAGLDRVARAWLPAGSPPG